MALSFNPFTKKKKEDQIQGSGYTSAYASNPGNTTASMFANSLSQGKGLPSITGQSLTVPSFQQKQKATQDIINQSNNKIQGSGYTSNYAQNPTNFSVPKVEQKQQTQQSSVPSYIGGYQNLADQKKALLDKQRQQGNEYYTKAYDERNRLLQESIPALQQQFLRTQANTQKGIDLNRQTAEYAKQNAQDQWGESQRLAAKTRQESEGRTRNKFAALGTTDSWGAGSYGQAQENVESDFNRFTQQGLRQKEQNLFDIDKELQIYEIEAQTKLDELNVELDTLERQIRSDITMNALDKQNALDELYNKYESAVMGVEEEMQGVYKDYYTSLQNADAQALSEQFMNTGVPATEADYRYKTQNYKAYQTGGGKKTEKQMAYEAAATIAGNALAKLNSGDVASGFGQKTFGAIGEKTGANTVAQQSYRSDIAAMRTAIQNALLGANMSPAEMEQIMAAIPQYNDNEAVAKQKLNSLMTNLPILAGSGQTAGLDENQIAEILASL
jgi:hypothetical protein